MPHGWNTVTEETIRLCRQCGFPDPEEICLRCVHYSPIYACTYTRGGTMEIPDACRAFRREYTFVGPHMFWVTEGGHRRYLDLRERAKMYHGDTGREQGNS